MIPIGLATATIPRNYYINSVNINLTGQNDDKVVFNRQILPPLKRKDPLRYFLDAENIFFFPDKVFTDHEVKKSLLRIKTLLRSL